MSQTAECDLFMTFQIGIAGGRTMQLTHDVGHNANWSNEIE